MCYRYIGGALLAAAAMLAGPSSALAQDTIEGADGGGFSVPPNTNPISPLPTGKPGDAGFYGATEFILLTQTRAIGGQTVAIRGFYDGDGLVTGKPGTIVGDGTEALNPEMFGRQSYQPGWNIELGYRFNDGTRFFMNYLQTYGARQSESATFVPPNFAVGVQDANTFISSPVFNFGNQWAGPTNKVNGVEPSTVYGLWNGAEMENMEFTQRFQQWSTGLRTPLFQTDFSRVYGSAGMQFSWLFERFWWRVTDMDQAGNTAPSDAANYTNTLSQRMYGPFVGMGHEIFIANQFSLSLDTTGALLLAVEKERAKYELGDQTIESKWGNVNWQMVPNANAALNLWWYPIDGVQIRAGYQAMMFFNTLYMSSPVGFNLGNINPGYSTQAFRLVHGLNVGIGFFF